jgi:hypothetical protein
VFAQDADENNSIKANRGACDSCLGFFCLSVFFSAPPSSPLVLLHGIVREVFLRSARKRIWIRRRSGLLRGIEREGLFYEEEEEEESPGLLSKDMVILLCLPFLLLHVGFQLSTLFCRTAYLFALLAGAFSPQMYMLC